MEEMAFMAVSVSERQMPIVTLSVEKEEHVNVVFIYWWMLIALKKPVQLFPKAVNIVIEHFRVEGTLRSSAQPPCPRQGQLDGSG